jgi:hypothetical protein
MLPKIARSSTLIVVFLTGVASAGWPAPASAVTRAETGHRPARTVYHIFRLSSLGGTGSVAEGLSDRGWIVGTSN